MQTIEEALGKLARSPFRSRFHLSREDRAYIEQKGMETIRRHCEDFVAKRLAPAEPENDGAQTPMRGHPVFRAQHRAKSFALRGGSVTRFSTTAA
ncbi:MAG: DUF4186 family protein [Clostridia bacterium]|nr:DUF4186 family protein [Clostridia bacterium]